jgi:hypothetical protein
MIIKFKFSAFLKLICLSDRQQKTTIKNRLIETDGGGYDYHKSLKLRIGRYLFEDTPFDEVVASVAGISKFCEQESAKFGLIQFQKWRNANPGPLTPLSGVTYESPAGLFRVSFDVTFGINIAGQNLAVHVWNTAKPDLRSDMVYAALSLIRDMYSSADKKPDDVAVLCLRDMKLYRLSDVKPEVTAGLNLARQIENVFQSVQKEIGIQSPGDRPGHPAPSPGI